MKSNQEERELRFEHLEPFIEPYINERALLTRAAYKKLLGLVDEDFLHRVKYGICSPEEMQLSELILRSARLPPKAGKRLAGEDNMTPSTIIRQLRKQVTNLTHTASHVATMNSELESQLNNMLELNVVLMKRCDLGKASLNSDDIFMINQYPKLARETIKKNATLGE